jgi:hypothetical protein
MASDRCVADGHHGSGRSGGKATNDHEGGRAWLIPAIIMRHEQGARIMRHEQGARGGVRRRGTGQGRHRSAAKEGLTMRRETYGIAAEDYHALAMAYEALEHPSYAARVSSLLGLPLEQALRLLPRPWCERLHAAARRAIERATAVAVTSLSAAPGRPAGTGAHRLLAMGSGAVGGYFGLPGMIVELPVSTVLMLRAIADIARSQGEDPASPETQLACVSVFAFGSRSDEDRYAEIGYYEVRTALALHLSSAMERIVQQGAKAETLPATVEIARLIARRFGVVVSDKAAAHLVPVVGATTGALINVIFMQHFQAVGRGHFTVRRLERQYGKEAVEAAYTAMTADDDAPRPPVRPVLVPTP